MKKIFSSKVLLIPAVAMLSLTACETSNECDDCTLQKSNYCQAMHDNNCNSASLTFYTDQLITACGKGEAEAYISKASQECMDRVLLCNDCD